MDDQPTLFEAIANGVVEKTATLSPDGVYRYDLTRDWTIGPRVVWVMLNPSTADAKVDDRTIGRCSGFTRDWGYHGFTVVNLWAYRSTSPRAMFEAEQAGADIVGPGNNKHLLDTLALAAAGRWPVVAAWGTNATPDRARFVYQLAWEAGPVDFLCLGTNADGSPKHPLYVRADTPLEPWSPR